MKYSMDNGKLQSKDLTPLMWGISNGRIWAGI